MAVQSDPVLDPFVRYLVAGDEFGDGMLERESVGSLEKARPAWAVDSIERSEDRQKRPGS